MVLRPRPAPLDLLIYMDALTSWGVGFWMEGKWIAWRSIPGWKSDGQDIGWLEMVAVELALHAIIGMGFKDVHLVFQSDNSGVVGAFKNGSSRNAPQNSIFCHIIHLFHNHNLWVTTAWIPSEDNPSDWHLPTITTFVRLITETSCPSIHNSWRRQLLSTLLVNYN